MAIDIVLTKNGLRQAFNDETAICFEDAGDYTYLTPFFEKLKTATAQIIDLYDDCVFEGDNLIALKQAIMEEITLVSNQNEEKWFVITGTQIQPIQKDIYQEVIKKDLIKKLGKWLILTNLAIEQNEKLIGIGD
jgi:hypothetical protein